MANIATAEKIEQRKSDILGAAMDVFSEKGYHEAGIADIAGQLGIGHGTVYRYFKNKREIFDAILSQGIQLVMGVVRENPPVADSLDEYFGQLQNISNGMMEVFVSDPRYVEIVFYQIGAVDPTISREMKKTVAMITREYLRNGVEKGFLRKEIDQEIVAHLVTAMMYEITDQVACKKGTSEDMAKWSEQLVNLMIKGISI